MVYELITEIDKINQNARNAISEIEKLYLLFRGRKESGNKFKGVYRFSDKYQVNLLKHPLKIP